LWLLEENAAQEILTFRAAFIGTFQNVPEVDFAAQLEKARASQPASRRDKMVAVIPVTGALESRPTGLGMLLGMSSYERIGAQFDYMMNEDSVGGVVLDVASPGGDVYGAQELADKIYQARACKPIVAVANPLMASGAFWIAAAAHRVVVTPSGDVGSVGVIASHVDNSTAYEKEGAKVTIIKSSGAPFKGETTDTAALSEEAMQHLQSRADAIEGRFMADLAKFRGVSVEHVAEHFGKGRICDAKTALKAGMVDKICTFQEIAGKMAAGRVRISSERASLDDWDGKTDAELTRERLTEKAREIMAVANPMAADIRRQIEEGGNAHH
jgi:signal peptide peptidase SppA